MRGRGRVLFLAGVAIAVVALVVAACGGGGGGEEKGDIKVGSIMDFTGDLAEFGPAINNGVKLAAKQINAAGGVLGGRKLVVVERDGATSPSVAADAARALIDVEKVVAVIGPLSSSATQTVANSVTIPKRVLEISPSATSPALTNLADNDFLFRTVVSDAFQGVILAKLAKELGYKNPAVMYVNDAYGNGLSTQFKTSFEQEGGKVAALVAHEKLQPSYASELQKAVANNPDVLVAISFPESAQVYLREAVEKGLIKKFLFVDGTKSLDLIKAVGPQNVEGTFGTAPASPDSTAKARFDADYTADFGKPPPLPFIREAYDAMVLIALAIEKAGSTDSVKIRDALRFVANPPGEKVGAGVDDIGRALKLIKDGKDVDYEGASGKVNFDEHGDVTGAIEIWKIVNGQIVTQRIELP